MHLWRWVGLTILCIISVSAMAVVCRSSAESTTVTIGVGDTVLTVNGQTSPNAFVTIIENGSVIGTTTAQADGTYTHTFLAQTPGLHELRIYAHSQGGQNTDTVALNLNVTEHLTTTASVFLPSTIIVEDLTLDYQQMLRLSGQTFPLSTVKVFIDNSEFVTATADIDGNWNAATGTTSLASGQHEFFVRATDSLGNQSYPTALRNFSLAAAPATAAPAPIPKAVAPPIPTIVFPTSGTVWREPSITITGQAAPSVQVELWDADRALASVWSDVDGNWAMNLELEPKEYQLRARACLAGACSAFSPVTTLTYQPDGLLSPLQQPLIIILPQLALTAIEGQPLTIYPTITQGQPPYKTTIHWGDGLSDNGIYAKDQLALTHTYSKAGKYIATLLAEDSQGRKGSLQFTVEVFAYGPTPWLQVILLFLIILLLFVAFLLANRKKWSKWRKKSKKDR